MKQRHLHLLNICHHLEKYTAPRQALIQHLHIFLFYTFSFEVRISKEIYSRKLDIPESFLSRCVFIQMCFYQDNCQVDSAHCTVCQMGG